MVPKHPIIDAKLHVAYRIYMACVRKTNVDADNTDTQMHGHTWAQTNRTDLYARTPR